MQLPSKRISIFVGIGLAALLAFAGPPQIRIQPLKPSLRDRHSERTLINRARHFEERGYNERALETWRAVLAQDAWNASAIDGIRRNLVYLKRYDEAIEFMEGVIARAQTRSSGATRLDEPTSPFALTLGLGEVYLAQGESERAWEIWDRALASESESPYAVMLLVKILQRNRLWHEAEELIRDFRRRARQPGFMARELARSLAVRMEWGAATRELMTYMKEVPAGWEIAQQFLARFPDDSAVHAEVSATLARTVRKQKRDINLRRLFAGYLFKIRDFAACYDQIVVVDSLADRHGAEILGLASKLLKEGQTHLASHAFSRVLTREPELGMRLQAELGMADCLLRLGKPGDAKAAYEAFVEAHSQTPEVTRARFRIATITLKHERRPEDALAKLHAIETGGKGVSASEVQLKMGDCLVWLDRTPEAIEVWQQVARRERKAEDLRAEASLRVARAHFWMDSLRLANAVLDSILKGDLASRCYNDAVHYRNLLTEGAHSEALRAFGQGDLFLFREEPGKAAEQFERTGKLARRGRLAEWGRYLQAVALRRADEGEAAAEVLGSFIADFPESRDVDRAIFLLAQVQEEDLLDVAAARASYEKILADFPESTYLEQARKRARALLKVL